MANPNFIATYSSDEVYFGQNELLCITDVVNEKANLDHTHSGYASQSDLDLLEDVVATKAASTHTHTEYAASSHTHSAYATQVALDTLAEEVDGKANTTHYHTEYAASSHTHAEYAASSHTHSDYAASSHDHDEDYAAIDHVHSDYATTTALNEVSSVVSGKANVSHTHNDIYYTETEVDAKLTGKSDTSHTHAGVYDANGAAANALTSANAYTDTAIANLLNNSTTAIDSIYELRDAMEENADAIEALETIAANKANATDLTSHTGNASIHVTSTDKSNWNAAKTHADSAHAPSNAQPNQNAFSNVVVGNTTIAADTTTDTLTIVAGSNITLTPSAANDSVTIAATNTVYTHPTTAGNKHIPDGGSSGQILRWSADGTAVWGADNNTTYSVATQTANGLMSNVDKTKLDGIAANANNYTLPSAGTSLGGVKTGGDVTISAGVITVNDDSHNHIISNIDGLQSALDGKAASGHTHGDIYYTETEVDTKLSGKANTSHTHTIANITNLQTTLDGKASSSHNHSGVYANASHTHTASAIGAVATGDVATVSEVETYLAI